LWRVMVFPFLDLVTVMVAAEAEAAKRRAVRRGRRIRRTAVGRRRRVWVGSFGRYGA
jgi:hypothetical protein